MKKRQIILGTIMLVLALGTLAFSIRTNSFHSR
jgi:hypothetical protein